MRSLSTLVFILLTGLMGAVLTSCDLFGDDEHCQFSPSRIETWTPGDYVSPHWVSGADHILYGPVDLMFGIYLGGKDFLDIQNVCTSRDVTLSATVDVHPDILPSVGSYVDFLLVYQTTSQIGLSPRFSHAIKLRRTNLDDTVLRLEPIQVPVWPDFESDNLSVGRMRAYIYIRISDDGFEASESESYQIATDNANAIVRSATITVEYTEF